MSSSALDSQGMLLQYLDTTASPLSPQTFTTIPEISNISGPGGQANEIDVTDLSSTAKEFRMGLQDEGSITIDMNYIPANAVHAAMRTARANQTLTTFRIKFTDSPNTVWTFTAFVLGFEVSNSVDDVTKASMTLRVSGSITES
jgi:hypothetical protein